MHMHVYYALLLLTPLWIPSFYYVSFFSLFFIVNVFLFQRNYHRAHCWANDEPAAVGHDVTRIQT